MDAARARSAARLAGGILGFIALIAAVAYILHTHADAARRVAQSLADAPPALVLAIVLLPLGNWLLSAAILYLLNNPRTDSPGVSRPRIGLGEMILLTGAAWLLNYLPMRPGLVGRIAYHRAINDVPIARSVVALVGVVIISACVLAYALAVAIFLPAERTAIAFAALLAPVPLLAGVAFAAHRARRNWFIWPAAAALRVLDVCVWALRYALVFAAIDHPIAAHHALMLAVVSQLAMLVPFFGNGLGLREWSIGLLGARVPGLAAAPGVVSAPALLADLTLRIAEIAVALPVGLLCSAAVARRLARRSPPN